MSHSGYYLEDLEVGQSAEFTKTVSEADLVSFAEVTGDVNPVHLDEEYASSTMFKGRIAHGILSAGFISAVVGVKLPGPGSIYVSQNLKFNAPVRIGDTVTARATVTQINMERRRVTLETICLVEDKIVVEGEAVMMVGNRPA
jgi:3-hydroxybutyryl-CoA dehydratase